MPNLFRERKGVSLIELLVALVITAIVVAALYRTFIGQQKTYTIQEQVVDVQQNARLAMNQIMRDLRATGFGRVAMVTSALRPNAPVTGALTIAITGNSTALKEILSPNQIRVVNNVFSSGMFSIGGIESHNVDPQNPPVKDPLDDTYIVTLWPGECIVNYHPPNTTPVYDITTISYKYEDGTIKRNDEILADNIESLQFRYYTSSTDEVGTDSPLKPEDVQRVRVTVIARTSVPDPEYKGGDGFRRREISSYVKIRNPIKP